MDWMIDNESVVSEIGLRYYRDAEERQNIG